MAPEASESYRMRLVLGRFLGVASPPLESSQDGGGVGELIIPVNSVEKDNHRLNLEILFSSLVEVVVSPAFSCDTLTHSLH